MEANFTFANWLKDELRTRGETKQSVAETAGIPLSRLTRILDGRELPRIKCCEKLAKALHIPLGIVLEAAGFKDMHFINESNEILILPFFETLVDDSFKDLIRFA